jgi:putative tricarboxylic transport membrane protein
MKRGERITAAILVFIGVVAAALAYELGFGDLHHPGPGFFPFWLSVILALVSFIYFISQLGADSYRKRLWDKHSWVRPSLAAMVMFFYSLAMGWIGFFPATFLLFLAWLILIERETLLTVSLVSVLGTASIYFIFTVFLKVPLPRGPLFK